MNVLRRAQRLEEVGTTRALVESGWASRRSPQR